MVFALNVFSYCTFFSCWLRSDTGGIATFELCESRTGYLWCFLVYTGKNTVIQSSLITPDTPKTAAIVLELLEHLFGRGNPLWLDNLFNRPELARRLKIKHSTDFVGTLKLNRMDVPKVAKNKKLERGEIIARNWSPVTILKWRDKNNLTMVSTYRSADTQRVSNKGMKQRRLCAWLIIIITWGESIWRTDCCTRTWSNGQEQKNDQMVPQTFQKAIELYSSQFVWCLSTNEKKKYTVALVQKSASGRSVHEICMCCGYVECTGKKGI